MDDHNQRAPRRKPPLIAPVIIALAFAAILVGVVLTRGRAGPPTIAPPAAPTPVVTPPVAAPAALASTPPPLGRADLIALAARAASAYAAGQPFDADQGPAGAPPTKGAILGRAFELRLAFGCEGPRPSSAPLARQARSDYDPGKKTLRLIAQPETWTDLPLVQQDPALGKIEAVEGFWITRPWSQADSCPPRRDAVALAAASAPIEQTLGLAQLFDTDSSRVGQRGQRPYIFTRKLADDDAQSLAHSYFLVLEGRITGFGDGQPIRCWSPSADHRPTCLYGVSLDHVTFQDAQSGAVLARWPE